ncbi:hypothetical protein LJK88_02330 [Paenibacillus sp. P26]|nr:hypothetical protein LJK88_02330 [Paenibacillus sp. P26]UUZ90987.1 hypothetical protein LJK87_35160 [Paenibacillus sp. P25]
MDKPSTYVLEPYRRALQRFAWRIQYRARKQSNREAASLDTDLFQSAGSHAPDFLSGLRLEELMGSIPSDKGRHIIKRIYIDGMKEKEVADELHISQQAVSKWKKKSLESMRRQII